MKLSGKILVKYFVFSDCKFSKFQESFVIDEVLWVNKNIFRYKCSKFQESFVIEEVLWVNKNNQLNY